MNRACHQDLFGCVVRLHVVLLLREDDVEDSMRAAAGLVHVGRSHSPEKEKGNHTFRPILLTHYLFQHSVPLCYLALFPESIRSWMSLYEVTASLDRSST